MAKGKAVSTIKAKEAVGLVSESHRELARKLYKRICFMDKTLNELEKQVKEEGGDVKAFLAEKEQEYSDLFANPYQAAKYGYIDDVIEPRNTRFRICRALAQLRTKQQNLPAKKHGCIPM